MFLTSSTKIEEALSLCNSNNVTHAYLQPTDLEEIAGKDSLTGDLKLSGVTVVATSESKDKGSDSITPDSVKQIKSKQPNLQIRQTWGLTETSSVSSVHSVDSADSISLGRLIPNTEAMVVDSRG